MTDLATKKSLGQHWLNDEATLKAICAAAELAPKDVVLEIGPGTGTLTRVLLKQANQVIAIEKDEQLAQKLSTTLKSPKLQTLARDIRTYDLGNLPSGYKLVANIPYYLTSYLLRSLSSTSNPPVLAVLLVQKEVAQRVCAGPNSMSTLSVSVQYYWRPSLGVRVPAELFIPPPKVDSQLLILKRRQKPLFPNVNERLFFRLVNAGFSERRKKLKSSLSGGLRLDKSAVLAILVSAGIDPNLRAQALSLQQWYNLYHQYSLNPSSPLPFKNNT